MLVYLLLTLLNVSVMTKFKRKRIVIVFEWSTRPNVGTRETVNVGKRCVLRVIILHEVVYSIRTLSSTCIVN